MKKFFLILFVIAGGVALFAYGKKMRDERSERSFREELEDLPAISG